MIDYVSLTEENLAEVHALSNRNLIHDRVPLDVFRYKTLGDPDFDAGLALVAMEAGQPCGFMMAACRTTDDGVTSGLKILAVDEASRNQRIASTMLARIVEGAAARGAKSMSVGFIRPNYLTPGLDPRYTTAAAFLLRRGFNRRGEAFNMDVDLSASDWSTDEIESRLSEQGITVRRLRHDERDRLREWMTGDGYSAGWQYQTLRAAEMDPCAVFVAEQGGEFTAFACYDGVRPGWFGPMGTRESMRGTGIGSVTFLRCLQSMKAVGYGVCEICAVGPLYFYSKVANARVSRIFWQWEKKLSDE